MCAATALSIHQFFFHLVQLEQCTSSLCQEQAAAMRSEVASTLTEALGRYVIYLKHCATRPPFRCAPAHRERADRAGRHRCAVGGTVPGHELALGGLCLCVEERVLLAQ